MLWKDKFKNIIDEMTCKYDAFRASKARLIGDIKEIFQYAAYSVNSLDDASYRRGSVSFAKANSTNNANNSGRINYEDYIANNININKTVKDINANTKNIKNNHLLQNISIIRNDLNNLEDVVMKDFVADINLSESAVLTNSSCSYSNAASELYSPERLSEIITIKNRYFWKTDDQLKDAIRTQAKTDVVCISSLIKDAMQLKVRHPMYSSIARINYDRMIASQEMKDDFIRAYVSSGDSLKVISYEFEKKYGMSISPSTISYNARKYLSLEGHEFKNRKETKQYYSHHSTIFI